MGNKQTLSARELAVEVLCHFSIRTHDAAAELHKRLSRTDQRGQATDLTFGVIRNQTLIDYLLEKICNVCPDRVHKQLFNVLRVGVYELIFAPQTADYAIVDQAVAQAKNKKTRGFINAVLRNMQRAISTRSDQNVSLGKNIIPQNTDSGCILKNDILPSPETKTADYISLVFSIPLWLINDWLDEFGFDKTLQICFASNRNPSVYIRPNIVRTTPYTLAQILEEEGIQTERIDAGILKFNYTGSVSKLQQFKKGLFSIQDITAAKVARFLDPQSGETIADICSAPGTKTTHIAELMKNTGLVLATDIDSKRLKRVNESASRLKISIIKTIPYENAFEQIRKAHPDAVLLDVPCSNTGVMAKRIELRHRIMQTRVAQLKQTQLELLKKVADELPDCAKICYSTCSIQACENSQLIQQFLLERPQFKLQSESLTLPSALSPDKDGGYVALLSRTVHTLR